MYTAIIHSIGFATLMITYWWTLVRGSTTSYVTSPLWLDIPFVHSIVALQTVSIACLAAWVIFMRDSTSSTVYGVSVGYYASSLLWPVLAKHFLVRPSLGRAIAASAPLWGAAACVLLLLNESPDTATRLLMVPIVVLTVVCDALLWTVSALRRGCR